jgi:hypothetical protein
VTVLCYGNVNLKDVGNSPVDANIMLNDERNEQTNTFKYLGYQIYRNHHTDINNNSSSFQYLYGAVNRTLGGRARTENLKVSSSNGYPTASEMKF